MAALNDETFRRFRDTKHHRSVRPICLMSHQYPYGPFAEYLEESGRLTNA